MKRILWLGAFTLSFLILPPLQVRADGYLVPADCAHGFGKLKAKALNSAPWIHQHGPLYNYGPYQPYGVGYNWMQIPQHKVGYYVPAYPYSVYSGQNAAPAAAPAPAAPVEHSAAPAIFASELSQVSYQGYTPVYLQNPWPSRR